MKFGLNTIFRDYKKEAVLLAFLVFTSIGCSTNTLGNNQDMMINDSHTSEMSLDWDGVYKGILPCASCPGISTTITLNLDKTFEKVDVYLEEENATFREKGIFVFTKDGDKIVLHHKNGSKSMYAVGENRLIMLDKDGKKSDSPFAEKYELKKELK